MAEPGADEVVPNIAHADDTSDALPRPARIGLSVVGSLAFIAGSVAVFVSDNQAGTAVLLVVSAALFIIGLQGTPLLRFGAGDNALELARIRNRAQAIVDVSRSQEPPDVAEAISNALESVVPGLEPLPTAPFREYEKKVLAALHRVAPSMRFVQEMAYDQIPVDVFVCDERGPRVGVEIKYRRAPLTLRHIDAVVGLSSRLNLLDGVLLVTTAPLDHGVRTILDGHQGPKKVEAVTWNSEQDDIALATALSRLLGPDGPTS